MECGDPSADVLAHGAASSSVVTRYCSRTARDASSSRASSLLDSTRRYQRDEKGVGKQARDRLEQRLASPLLARFLLFIRAETIHIFVVVAKHVFASPITERVTDRVDLAAHPGDGGLKE